MPQRFEVAKNNVLLHGAVIEIDNASGKALRIQRVSEHLRLSERLPADGNQAETGRLLGGDGGGPEGVETKTRNAAGQIQTQKDSHGSRTPGAASWPVKADPAF
jgi:hypothetical protein